MTETTQQIRYFVASGLAGYGPDGADGFTCVSTWRNAADAIASELRDWSEIAYQSAEGFAEMSDYESAWREHKRSESLDIMARNFDNARADAPLYAGDPHLWDSAIRDMIATHFPLDVSESSRVYVWECDDSDAWYEHAEVCRACDLGYEYGHDTDCPEPTEPN